jgi:hypothetical protein
MCSGGGGVGAGKLAASKVFPVLLLGVAGAGMFAKHPSAGRGPELVHVVHVALLEAPLDSNAR